MEVNAIYFTRVTQGKEELPPLNLNIVVTLRQDIFKLFFAALTLIQCLHTLLDLFDLYLFR